MRENREARIPVTPEPWGGTHAAYVGLGAAGPLPSAVSATGITCSEQLWKSLETSSLVAGVSEISFSLKSQERGREVPLGCRKVLVSSPRGQKASAEGQVSPERRCPRAGWGCTHSKPLVLSLRHMGLRPLCGPENINLPLGRLSFQISAQDTKARPAWLSG